MEATTTKGNEMTITSQPTKVEAYEITPASPLLGDAVLHVCDQCVEFIPQAMYEDVMAVDPVDGMICETCGKIVDRGHWTV